ncbi:alpha-N-arabinofuranosidase [Acetobacteraceae bacterium KSS8]|uniref:non-reducing end alpha-L-arabinofuranosidase n=1 Tax=Endosaccharibacter trunci TaxID=2812733 RepID=A0ABT1W9D1_9PROT|nr:alpha-N-arabinofuranosidase [Acetobacteraceae bacterium KSS8]
MSAWWAAVLAILMPAAAAAAADHVTIDGAPRTKTVLDRHIFGQFSEQLGRGIEDGIWVGPDSRIPNIDGFRRDVVEGLKALHVSDIRWPGGCFADEYHWRDGIGPRDRRPVRTNTNWGDTTEDNAFGTQEFMRFTALVGADRYLAVNLGSASPSEGAEWLQYITAPHGSTLANERSTNGDPQPWTVSMIGIGNELWGCGGTMEAGYAADLTRRYATFLKVPDSMHALKIASGPYGDDTAWTETMMRHASDQIDGLSLHFYTMPKDWKHVAKSHATGFDQTDWTRVLSMAAQMDTVLSAQERVMDKYDPSRRVALIVDEWGTWYEPEPGTNPHWLFQQNTIRDALVASTTFDIFARHAARVRGANIAQMVNVLQALFLTDGATTIRTPTYWAFDLYKNDQGGSVLPTRVTTHRLTHGSWSIEALSASAVRGRDGVVRLALTNTDPEQSDAVDVSLSGLSERNVSGRILTGPAMDARNTAEHPDAVRPAPFESAVLSGNALQVTLPPRSVVMLELR